MNLHVPNFGQVEKLGRKCHRNDNIMEFNEILFSNESIKFILICCLVYYVNKLGQDFGLVLRNINKASTQLFRIHFITINDQCPVNLHNSLYLHFLNGSIVR